MYYFPECTERGKHRTSQALSSTDRMDWNDSAAGDPTSYFLWLATCKRRRTNIPNGPGPDGRWSTLKESGLTPSGNSPPVESHEPEPYAKQSRRGSGQEQPTVHIVIPLFSRTSRMHLCSFLHQGGESTAVETREKAEGKNPKLKNDASVSGPKYIPIVFAHRCSSDSTPRADAVDS